MKSAITSVLGLGGTVVALIAAVPVPVPARMSVEQLRTELGRLGDRYIDVAGVRVRYRDEGRGPVLLLLHGSRSTLNAWDGVAAELKAHYRVVRFDQPPTGLSGPVSDAVAARISAPEAFTAAFLDALKITKVTPVGVSSGGTLGYYFAATYPDRVDALVLSNTPSDSVTNLKLPSTPALDAALAATKKTGIEGRDFWQAYLSFLYGDQSRLSPATVDYYYRSNLRTAEPNKFKLHALTADAPTTMARLHGVKAPVLILWGMHDPVMTPTEGRALVAHLDSASAISFVGMPDVGHYPPMEVPHRFAVVVDAYLQATRP
jgi:pimeloyl-ACP methyl ester carboxylesterase